MKNIIWVFVLILVIWWATTLFSGSDEQQAETSDTATTSESADVEQDNDNSVPAAPVNNPGPASSAPGAATVDSTPTRRAPTALTFDIVGSDFEFSQKVIKVVKGDYVTINFSSSANFHDLVIDEYDVSTSRVKPGTPSSVSFVADKAGAFQFYCSVGSHKEKGMVGVLIVE